MSGSSSTIMSGSSSCISESESLSEIRLGGSSSSLTNMTTNWLLRVDGLIRSASS